MWKLDVLKVLIRVRESKAWITLCSIILDTKIEYRRDARIDFGSAEAMLKAPATDRVYRRDVVGNFVSLYEWKGTEVFVLNAKAEYRRDARMDFGSAEVRLKLQRRIGSVVRCCWRFSVSVWRKGSDVLVLNHTRLTRLLPT